MESFKPFADKLPEGMLLLTSQGEILSANRAACRLLQRTHSELVHRNLSLITDSTQVEVVNRLRPCSRSRTPVKVAIKFNAKPKSKELSIQATGFLFTPATESVSAQVLLRLHQNVSSNSQFATLKQEIGKQNNMLRLLSQSRETLRVSEEKLSIILNSIGNGVVTTDSKGVIGFVNPAALQMLRYGMDEIVGRGFHALIQHTRGDGTRYPAEESPIYRTYRQGGANQVDDELFWRKDGSCFASEYKVHPVLKDNRVSGSVIVFSDITERRAMDDKLKHHEFLSDQALGLTRSGYWHVPMDGSGYYNSSKRAVDIFGDIPNDDFRYRIVEDWFVYVEAGDMEASKLTWKKFQDAIEGKIPAYDSMYAYKRPVDGAVVWIRAYGTVARDGKGNASDMYGVAQDVTEYVHSQQALKLAKEAAEAANKAKSAFLANMSHELRTPMNAILGYSEMLVEEAEEVGQDDFIPDLQKINQAGAHLLALINDVLDLSKIESGRMELTAEDYDVNALIDQVALTAQPLMNQNNNRFRIERGERLGRVFQDATKLRQALLNLVSNAAKFTHDGSVTLSIERDSEYGVDWLNFAVKDTGIGIAAEKLEQIFEEFSQADNSTTRDYGGTGLGLTISRRLCQMLGGELSVSSRPGGGSTFTIRVPVALPGEAAPLEVSSQLGGEAKLAAIDVKMAADGKTVLVIDDDAEACEIIRRFLKKEGFAVVTALSGEAGLRLAHQLRPVAITLDVIMPDMDGFDFLLEMRTNAQWQDIPVIVLTAKDLTEEDRRLLNGRVEQELTIIPSRPAGTAEQVTSPVCSEDELDPRRA